jgi:hypothetical protein
MVLECLKKTMEIIKPFDKTIIRIECTDENLYRNDDLNRSVEGLLSLSDVQNRTRGEKSDSHVGAGVTSVGQTYLQLVHLPGSQALADWIAKQMLEAKDIFCIDKQANSVEYKRSWVNRLYKGAQGKCHQHIELDDYMRERTNYSPINFRGDIVGIFYVDVPPNASNLVIIKDGKPGTYVSDYNVEDTFIVKPSAGQLVLHTPDVWHAVSEHQSNLHRTCFVFDANYIE